MELAVCGGSAFTLGFRFSGIRHIRTVEHEPAAAFKELLQQPEIGIILTDPETMQKLPEHLRQQLTASVQPVVIVVSTEGDAQEELRKMIKKSIGVDLWV